MKVPIRGPPFQHFGVARIIQVIGQLPARFSERIVSAMKQLVIVGLLLGVVMSDGAPVAEGQ